MCKKRIIRSKKLAYFPSGCENSTEGKETAYENKISEITVRLDTFASRSKYQIRGPIFEMKKSKNY